MPFLDDPVDLFVNLLVDRRRRRRIERDEVGGGRGMSAVLEEAAAQSDAIDALPRPGARWRLDPPDRWSQWSYLDDAWRPADDPPSALRSLGAGEAGHGARAWRADPGTGGWVADDPDGRGGHDSSATAGEGATPSVPPSTPASAPAPGSTAEEGADTARPVVSTPRPSRERGWPVIAWAGASVVSAFFVLLAVDVVRWGWFAARAIGPFALGNPLPDAPAYPPRPDPAEVVGLLVSWLVLAVLVRAVTAGADRPTLGQDRSRR